MIAAIPTDSGTMTNSMVRRELRDDIVAEKGSVIKRLGFWR
jgi:hypothetical protein